MEGPFHGQRSIDNGVQDIAISSPNDQMPSIFARKFSPGKIWKLNLGENSSISSSNYIDDPRDSLRQFICQPISGMMTISIIYKTPLFKLLHQYLFSFSSTLTFTLFLLMDYSSFLLVALSISPALFVSSFSYWLANLFWPIFVFVRQQMKNKSYWQWPWHFVKLIICFFVCFCLIVKQNASYWEWS